MNALTTPKGFIARGKAHKILSIILHTTKVTQAMSLPEVQPKTIFNIVGDHFTPNMAIVLSIHALHFGRVMSIGKQRWQLKQDIPIKFIFFKWDFLNMYFVIIQILQLVGAPS
jgi:hypothetical protein